VERLSSVAPKKCSDRCLDSHAPTHRNRQYSEKFDGIYVGRCGLTLPARCLDLDHIVLADQRRNADQRACRQMFC